MDNSIFDSEINSQMHQSHLDLAKLNLEISNSTLKVLTTLTEIFSNLSITNIPKIISDIGALANPIADAIKKTTEAIIKQSQAVQQLTKIQSTVQLPDLSKINPIKNISKPDLIDQSLSGK